MAVATCPVTTGSGAASTACRSLSRSALSGSARAVGGTALRGALTPAGVTEVGLFRLSGLQTRIKELKEEFNAGQTGCIGIGNHAPQRRTSTLQASRTCMPLRRCLSCTCASCRSRC